MITLPSTVIKGSNITVQLSVPNLLNKGIISSDIYFSDTTNWKEISIQWNDENVNQKVLFKAKYNGESGLITRDILVTSEYKSNNLFFRELTIYDKSNGFVKIPRESISPNTKFDMEF